MGGTCTTPRPDAGKIDSLPGTCLSNADREPGIKSDLMGLNHIRGMALNADVNLLSRSKRDMWPYQTEPEKNINFHMAVHPTVISNGFLHHHKYRAHQSETVSSLTLPDDTTFIFGLAAGRVTNKK